jgi:hypothetical protein
MTEATATIRKLAPRLALALAVLAGCQASPPPPPQSATVERTKEVAATVEAIDQTARLVTLKGPEGGLLTVHAGEEVRNLPQVEVGDRVVVRYHEAIAAELAELGEAAPATVARAQVTRAPLGARPGAGVRQQVKTTVRIEELDLENHTVTFTEPDGVWQTLTVQDPAMQDFLETLKVGDEVAVTYTEAVAISVEPAAR